jgi:hypothetical protein
MGGQEMTELLNNSLVDVVLVLAVIFLFLKFCGFARGFSLSAGLKKIIYILTGVGLVVFNVLYSVGNSKLSEGGSFGYASVALVAALAWVLIFSFALAAETKARS